MKMAITDLKDYNEGKLRFEWLDLEEYSSKQEIQDQINSFLGNNEECFITDYEEFVNLGEYPDLEDVEKAISLSKEFGWEVVARYYEYHNDFDNFEEAYSGIYDSEEDFAYELAQDIYSEEQLGTLKLYIDWERFARDLFISDYYSDKVEDYKVAVFRIF